MVFCAVILALGGSFSAPTTGKSAVVVTHKTYLPIIMSNRYQLSTSLYMGSMSASNAYQLGCQAGHADLLKPGAQDTLIILDFGQPWVQGGVYGVWNFSGPFASIWSVGQAVREFGHGYWVCTGADNASHITLGIGTSNYGPFADDGSCASRAACSRVHGEKWAYLVADAQSWMTIQGYATQVTVAGANDIEQSWNTPAVTIPWVDGFDDYDQNRFIYYNYGSCSNCPTRLDTSLVPPNGWTTWSVFYVSYGVLPSWPIPEIYANSGVNARQWAYLSYYAATHNWGGPVYYPGLMTEWQSCQQYPSGCDPIDNTPNDGWSQLKSELAYWPVTTQPYIPWVTDIAWTPRSPTSLVSGAGHNQSSMVSAVAARLEQELSPQAQTLLQAKLEMLQNQAADRVLAAQFARPKPLDPQAEAPALDVGGVDRGPGGIISQGRPPVSAQAAEVLNHWAGDVNGTWTAVFGGYDPSNPRQGLVVWVQPDTGLVMIIPAPLEAGALTVIEADGSLILLEDGEGQTWMFDAAVAQWR